MFYVILKFGIENENKHKDVLEVYTTFKSEDVFDSIGDDLHEMVIHLANDWKGIPNGYHVEEVYVDRVIQQLPEGVDVWNLTHLDVDSDSDYSD
tara:strand:- start:71 stop:352 length:282 start_codon:yes stop_codon:yes gene_type:complete